MFCAIDFRSLGSTNVKCVIKRARKFEFAGRTSAHKLAALTKSCVQTHAGASGGSKQSETRCVPAAAVAFQSKTNYIGVLS